MLLGDLIVEEFVVALELLFPCLQLTTLPFDAVVVVEEFVDVLIIEVGAVFPLVEEVDPDFPLAALDVFVVLPLAEPVELTVFPFAGVLELVPAPLGS